MDRSCTRRRTFCAGRGGLALPLLESLPRRPRRRRPSSRRVRAAFLYFPNGVWQENWIPKKAGRRLRACRSSLDPLADLKKDVLVLSGPGQEAQPRRAMATTPRRPTSSPGCTVPRRPARTSTSAASRSINSSPQQARRPHAAALAGTRHRPGHLRHRQHRRLHAAVRLLHLVAVGPTCRWPARSTRVWSTTACSARTRPAARAAGDDDAALLDLPLEDARGLRGKLGRDDQFKLDEYLDVVRAVEKQIEFAAKPAAGYSRRACPSRPRRPRRAGIPPSYREHVKLMLDLMVLAFWTDSTRVTTFMFANDVSRPELLVRRRRQGRAPRPVAPREHEGQDRAVQRSTAGTSRSSPT